ncbi:NUDIX domain-containing protein [Sulfuriroseicoccus oceanibius]|uniref:NUDIX domain-containing protein n=1 Tax=Sulfuriroseicoccus oceanibius TaxID=2707525 RepID=A0A6B3L9G6_9BACT|nr:NUDIX domain-containing protein [Sulfuriroseicoccus oceanibius]QQL46150.1 NUDIX domain-containing protein [Sulfuriroseicoccus oceanibius]
MPKSATLLRKTKLRDNVAVLLRRADGRLLMGRCADRPAEWQFPQGGVGVREKLRCAMFRELFEETGVRKSQVEVVEKRGPYIYVFPNGRLKKGIYHGQSQTYFLCDLLGNPDKIDVARAGEEFSEIEWIRPEEFPFERTPEFKHSVYRQVMRDFFGA